ncbi:VOC family protein [Microvirga lenta]|uniref:VOC family protein n=1 Tax=Microvirga lenta TaxID=2881337 RepID=UPI001CFF9FD4|nr:VOC family protein [Microvirga lenta]MCB5175475.1 VOC family protein [Microvirga lenta]
MLALLPLLALAVPMTAPGPAASAPVSRPSSASIRTPDFDETVAWYRDRLGFRLLSTRSLLRERVALMERSGFLLEIAEADHPMPPGPGPNLDATGATRAPVVSVLVQDVDREVSRLRAEGVDILEEPQDELEGDFRIAQIRDNGRHRIELREPLGASFNAMGR